MKIGEFVYVLENNNFSYGRIIQFRESEKGTENICVECIDDLYFGLSINNIFYTKEAFMQKLMYYLKGDEQ